MCVGAAGVFHGLGFSEVLKGATHLPVLKLMGFNLGALACVLVGGAVVACCVVLGRRLFGDPFKRHLVRWVSVSALVVGLATTADRLGHFIEEFHPPTHHGKHQH